MTTTYKMLGQSAPSPDAITFNYGETPSNKSALIRSINICNTSNSTDQVSVALIPDGTLPEGPENYIIFAKSIPAYTTLTLKSGYTLGPLGAIKVYSFAGTSTFTTFGAEIS